MLMICNCLFGKTKGNIYWFICIYVHLCVRHHIDSDLEARVCFFPAVICMGGGGEGDGEGEGGGRWLLLVYEPYQATVG